MTAMKHIRKHVLQISQQEMATLANTSQATVSRWERGEMQPDLEQLAAIRAEAKRRRIKWDDALFFMTTEASAATPSEVAA